MTDEQRQGEQHSPHQMSQPKPNPDQVRRDDDEAVWYDDWYWMCQDMAYGYHPVPVHIDDNRVKYHMPRVRPADCGMGHWVKWNEDPMLIKHSYDAVPWEVE